MRSIHIVELLDTGASAATDAADSPFQAGNEIVAIVNISAGGTGGGRGWTIEGNNEPEGSTPAWEALAAEVLDEQHGIHTITMPRQIRLNVSTAGSGSKAAALHLLGGM